MKTLSKLALLALVSLVFSGHVFAASDEHSYNGIGCLPSFGSEAGKLRRDQNGITNLTNDGVYIACPVEVDAVGNLTGTNQIRFHWNGPINLPIAMQCAFTHLDENGNKKDESITKWVGRGWHTFEKNITNEDPKGSSNLICYLPGKSTLHSYYVSENQ